ncbi:PucR family transcriptional regulator [Neobacillus rhizophilus]|uniref:PucR family transcriptional regulator ligand-binding domain-containing protein n=1 Tax=Neobacillus rhizophilus TaxID=2833579 RepID=A0A942YTT8_9BACI|nr:PucR family transcriptional regulator [Neobacillus rhizophilus]MBS4211275.1 PucR family transcriptional regulator ligand-binding domain-containing protein [Neobacillus rhizophilus]
MAFTVSDILKTRLIPGCRVVAGGRGLNRNIRSVSIMDEPDTSWLKQGDLLLTTGYVFKDHQATQIKLLNDLAKRNCAGLAIKVKRYLTEIPACMLEEADRLGLPLIELPYENVLSDSLLSITREILEDEQRQSCDKDEAFKILLTGEKTDEEKVRSIADELKIRHDNHFVLLYLSGVEQKMVHSVFSQLVSAAEKKANARLISIPFPQALAVLVSVTALKSHELANLARKTASFLANQIHIKFPKHQVQIGVGLPCAGLGTVGRSYKEALEAISLGKKLSKEVKDTVFEYRNYAPEGLLQQLPEDSLKNYFHSMLESLSEYDQENGFNMLFTLEAYLECGGKLLDTANRLFVHRNTVKFRIVRIEELLELDLTDNQVQFRLLLAIRIARMLGMLPGYSESQLRSTQY